MFSAACEMHQKIECFVPMITVSQVVSSKRSGKVSAGPASKSKLHFGNWSFRSPLTADDVTVRAPILAVEDRTFRLRLCRHNAFRLFFRMA